MSLFSYIRVSLPLTRLGKFLFEKFESLGGALQFAYPEINWEQDKFSFRGKKSGQRWLRVKIEEMMPGIEIIEDFQHPALAWGMIFIIVTFSKRFENLEISKRQMELDLWLPKYEIGVEYQGDGIVAFHSCPFAACLLICRRAALLQFGQRFWPQWDCRTLLGA
jgi:hypothetical protein